MFRGNERRESCSDCEERMAKPSWRDEVPRAPSARVLVRAAKRSVSGERRSFELADAPWSAGALASPHSARPAPAPLPSHRSAGRVRKRGPLPTRPRRIAAPEKRRTLRAPARWLLGMQLGIPVRWEDSSPPSWLARASQRRHLSCMRRSRLTHNTGCVKVSQTPRAAHRR